MSIPSKININIGNNIRIDRFAKIDVGGNTAHINLPCQNGEINLNCNNLEIDNYNKNKNGLRIFSGNNSTVNINGKLYTEPKLYL